MLCRRFLDKYADANMRKVVQQSAKLNDADFDFTAIPADSIESQIDGWDIV